MNQWDKGEMLETDSRTDVVDFESIAFTLKFD